LRRKIEKEGKKKKKRYFGGKNLQNAKKKRWSSEPGGCQTPAIVGKDLKKRVEETGGGGRGNVADACFCGKTKEKLVKISDRSARRNENSVFKRWEKSSKREGAGKTKKTSGRAR